MSRRALMVLFASWAVVLGTTPAVGMCAQRTKATVDHVTDGDTIKVDIGAREEYVRFIGIDTPETYEGSECGGRQATASMKRMLQPGDRVTLVSDRSQGNRDDYDRLLRYVEFRGNDLGENQARKGWADVFVYDRRFKRLGAYEKAEARARKANRGVWRLCGGFPRRG